MSPQVLESPGTRDTPNWSALYRARGDEVSATRPIFTGDIFRIPEAAAETDMESKIILVLQHPCALRTNGVDLVPRLLVAEVREHPPIMAGEWKGRFKLMPLPEMHANDTHFAAHLHNPDLVDSGSLLLENRIVSMSQVGVNLLLQRWVHHNSRVIVPTTEYQKVTEEQFEEADLVEDWCDDLVSEITDIRVETEAAHDWLRSPSTEEGRSWQELLQNPQSRATVRSAMRKHVRELRNSRT